MPQLQLGLAISREALTRGQGIDRLRASYGQVWNLAKGPGRRRLLWLILRVLRPRGLHMATPCTKWCILGLAVPDAAAWALVALTIDCLLHQQAANHRGDG